MTPQNSYSVHDAESQEIVKIWLFQATKLAKNQIVIIIIKDENSTRPAMIFVRSFNFTHYYLLLLRNAHKFGSSSILVKSIW